MYDEYIKNPRSELRNDLQALFNFESPEAINLTIGYIWSFKDDMGV